MVVPEPQAGEAALVPGMSVIGVRSLRQVVAHLCGQEIPEAPEVEPMASSSLLSWRGDRRISDLDMVDVLGMADARFALEVTAAGGHHLMLSGPKGAGKTTLAERCPVCCRTSPWRSPSSSALSTRSPAVCRPARP